MQRLNTKYQVIRFASKYQVCLLIQIKYDLLTPISYHSFEKFFDTEKFEEKTNSVHSQNKIEDP